MRDITLEETIYPKFTTRAFATGIPTTLAGTPVLSVYEENNLTQITAGVSVTVDYDSITGLNQATIVATAANGYESGKSYDVVVTTGTVGGVSVVGEVVASFTIEASAAATDLANATDGLSALKTLIDTIDTVVDGIQTDLSNGTDGLGALKTLIDTIDTVVDAIKVVTDALPDSGALSTITTHLTDIKGGTFSGATDSLEAIRNQGDSAWATATGFSTHSAADVRTEMDANSTQLAAIVADTNELQGDWANGGRLDLILDELTTQGDTNETAIGALNDISAADVLTQVNAALDTAIAELGVAAPTATPTLRTGLMLLYMMARNRVDVDTTGTDAMKIYNDAGTQIASKAITDDGTDYSEAEMT